MWNSREVWILWGDSEGLHPKKHGKGAAAEDMKTLLGPQWRHALSLTLERGRLSSVSSEQKHDLEIDARRDVHIPMMLPVTALPKER